MFEQVYCAISACLEDDCDNTLGPARQSEHLTAGLQVDAFYAVLVTTFISLRYSVIKIVLGLQCPTLIFRLQL